MSSARLITLLGQVPGIGRGLRWMARRYPEGSVVTIRHGVAAGLSWKRHHRYVNGYWIGHYELAIQQALERELEPGQTFYDIGANAGFFSLVGARCVGPAGRVVAFDPSPDNLASVEEQVRLNRLENVIRWSGEAVGDHEGKAVFAYTAPGDATGHLGEAQAGEWAIEVAVTTVDCAARRFGPPDFIKVDVEGFEAQVLEGARGILRTVRPGWLLEIHGPQQAGAVRELLTGFGYRFYEVDGRPVLEGNELPHHVIARAV